MLLASAALIVPDAQGQEPRPELPNVNWLHVEVAFGAAAAMSFVLESETGGGAVSIVAPIAAVAVAGGLKETSDCGGECARQGDFLSFMAGAVPGAVLGYFVSKWIHDDDTRGKSRAYESVEWSAERQPAVTSARVDWTGHEDAEPKPTLRPTPSAAPQKTQTLLGTRMGAFLYPVFGGW